MAKPSKPARARRAPAKARRLAPILAPQRGALQCPGCGSRQFTRSHPPLALKVAAVVNLAVPVGGAFRPMRTCKVCGWTVEVAS